MWLRCVWCGSDPRNPLNVALECRFTLGSKALMSPAYSEAPNDGSLYCWIEVRPCMLSVSRRPVHVLPVLLDRGLPLHAQCLAGLFMCSLFCWMEVCRCMPSALQALFLCSCSARWRSAPACSIPCEPAVYPHAWAAHATCLPDLGIEGWLAHA